MARITAHEIIRVGEDNIKLFHNIKSGQRFDMMGRSFIFLFLTKNNYVVAKEKGHTIVLSPSEPSLPFPRYFRDEISEYNQMQQEFMQK